MKQIKKFDIHAKPIKMRWYLAPLLFFVVPFIMLSYKKKIEKVGFKKIKGGCLIISNHMSFEDFKFMIEIIKPRRSFFVASIDEFIGKEWIMRRLGCLPKKVHYRDMALVRNIVRLLKKGNLVTIYPEATYSFAGITNVFDQGLGKLAKMANVPVIVVHHYGNYLYSPRWNTHPKNKEVPLITKAIQVVNKEEVTSLSEYEIQERINKAFEYDEYKYQRDNNILIKSKTKAKNIERILYRCPNCNNEKCIEGNGNLIKCNSCNETYEIDELSILHSLKGDTKFTNISDWFLWQKQVVKENIEENTLNETFPVKISKLINSKYGFDHNFAKGYATLNNHGVFIKAKVNETQEDFEFEYNEKMNSTIHLTFDVKGCKESAFEVHNATDSYLVYPLDKTSIVKVRFAIEEAHKKAYK